MPLRSHVSPVRVVLGLFAVVCLAALCLSEPMAPTAEAANWRDLTGRMAPDLVFTEVANGLPSGTRLSSYRHRSVVLLVFWLRDCPHCQRELPRVQQLFAENQRKGLQVISVVHRFPLAQVLPTMRAQGWTFPVARDPTGSLAAPYGGGRRPASYVIGLDGRVKASNSLAMDVIRKELGRWRLTELGEVPPALGEARRFVYQGDYGAALRSAEATASTDASAEVRAAVARLAQLAASKLDNRVRAAEDAFARGHPQVARRHYVAMVQDFRGTSLEARARAQHDQFLARSGGR